MLASGCSTERLPVTPRAGIAKAPAGAATTAQGWKKETVLVTVVADDDVEHVAAAYGATVVKSGWRVAGLLPAYGETTDDLLRDVQSDARVLTAEKNTPVESAEMRQKSWAFDDGSGTAEVCEYQPATYSCGLHEAHRVSEGQGVLVAVLDTGADLTHPWLASRVAGGWDFVQSDADPSETGDDYDNDYDGDVDEGLGHGTHVAGVVALAAPQAGLLVVRVLDSDGRGDMLSVAQGIRWSVANGARVINMSLGGLVRSDAVKLALDEAYAANVVCVAAAGNWGATQPVEYPANYPHVMAVAATDDQDRLASFSSYGDFVSLCAPGVAIRSSYRNGCYALWSGTSMAAPWVSGGAALLLARYPDWTGNQVVDRVQSTARAIWKENPALRQSLGAGGLDMAAAFSAELATVAQ